MPKFLFTLWEGGGETPPILSVIRATAAAGHDVTVLADQVLGADVEAAGATWVPWTTAPSKRSYSPDEDLARDWEARTSLGAFQRFRDGIAFGPSARYARDTLAQARADRPDVVVNPTLMFGAQAAAEAAGIPQAVLLTCSYVVPGTGASPYGSGWAPPRTAAQRLRLALMDRLALRLWASGLPPLNAARAELHLPPVAHPLDQIHAAERFLVLTSPSFDFPVPRLPENVRYVGPRLDDPAWAGDWSPPAGDAPLVLVGLSSTYMDQGDLLRRIVAALGELPVRGLVTLGPALEPDSLQAPPNVTVVAGGGRAGRGAPDGPRPARQRGPRGRGRRGCRAQAQGRAGRHPRGGGRDPRRAPVRRRRRSRRRGHRGRERDRPGAGRVGVARGRDARHRGGLRPGACARSRNAPGDSAL
jgi:UDP:flavonoid glycosyltransferase YjiC (YdhE family)